MNQDSEHTFRKKILIIDDEQSIRSLLKRQLNRSGFATVSAADGLRGLHTAVKERPDLILLDVMMPQMNGFEVCRRIRNHPELAETPVIFLTASMTRENRVQAFAVGADDFVVKPFKWAELLAQITGVLRRGQTVDTTSGRIVVLFGATSGVGATTLSIQLSKAMAISEDRPVMLVDLDLAASNMAARLQLYHEPHIVDVLSKSVTELTSEVVCNIAQRHSAGLLVIPGPKWPIDSHAVSSMRLKQFLETMRSAGYLVVLDLGSELNNLVLTALKDADMACIVTSGESEANEQHDLLLASARNLGLDPRRLLSVMNEVHGATVSEPTFPILTHIAQAGERVRPYLWLLDQGMQKLRLAIA